MLNAKAMAGIGLDALATAHQELFGVGKPQPMNGLRLLLYSFAYSKASFLTEQEIQNIDKRVTDIII